MCVVSACPSTHTSARKLADANFSAYVPACAAVKVVRYQPTPWNRSPREAGAGVSEETEDDA